MAKVGRKGGRKGLVNIYCMVQNGSGYIHVLSRDVKKHSKSGGHMHAGAPLLPKKGIQ